MAGGIPYWLSAAVALVGLVVIAGWLLYLNPKHVAIRVLAAFFVARGVSGLVSTLRVSPDPFVAANAGLWIPAATGPAFALVVGFAALYPTPRGWLARPARVWLLALAATGVGALAFARQDLAIVFERINGVMTAQPGPLALLEAVYVSAIAIIGLLFLLRAKREGHTPLRGSLFLIGVGLTLDVAMVTVRTTLGLAVGRYHGGEWVVPYQVILALGIVPVAAAAVLIARDALRVRLARGALALVGVAVANALLILATTTNDGELLPTLSRALWRLSVPLFVTYAVVRHQLFDIDLKLKWTLRRGTLAASFIAVFFIVAQIGQTFLSEKYGLILGGTAAGLMLFAIAPLQRMAEQVANVAMPGVHDPREAPPDGRLEAYRAAVEMALADGVLTRFEERALAKLSTELGISPEVALALRDETETRMGVRVRLAE